jgi:hypothetical protein
VHLLVRDSLGDERMKPDTTIVLIAGEKRSQIPAPDGFDWEHYPAVIVHDGIPYHYVGCLDGTPYYKVKE